MKQSYKEAFAEIDDILRLMPIQLLNRIPTDFKNMINSEKSVNYRPNITEPFEEQQLKEETIIILGLIYRDFLCSEKEREVLKAKDAEKMKEAEEELRKKYNPDDIFKKRKELKGEALEEILVLFHHLGYPIVGFLGYVK